MKKGKKVVVASASVKSIPRAESSQGTVDDDARQQHDNQTELNARLRVSKST